MAPRDTNVGSTAGLRDTFLERVHPGLCHPTSSASYPGPCVGLICADSPTVNDGLRTSMRLHELSISVDTPGLVTIGLFLVLGANDGGDSAPWFSLKLWDKRISVPGGDLLGSATIARLPPLWRTARGMQKGTVLQQEFHDSEAFMVSHDRRR